MKEVLAHLNAKGPIPEGNRCWRYRGKRPATARRQDTAAPVTQVDRQVGAGLHLKVLLWPCSRRGGRGGEVWGTEAQPADGHQVAGLEATEVNWQISVTCNRVGFFKDF